MPSLDDNPPVVIPKKPQTWNYVSQLCWVARLDDDTCQVDERFCESYDRHWVSHEIPIRDMPNNLRDDIGAARIELSLEAVRSEA